MKNGKDEKFSLFSAPANRRFDASSESVEKPEKETLAAAQRRSGEILIRILLSFILHNSLSHIKLPSILYSLRSPRRRVSAWEFSNKYFSYSLSRLCVINYGEMYA
jgi:hypothetical protein